MLKLLPEVVKQDVEPFLFDSMSFEFQCKMQTWKAFQINRKVSLKQM